LNFTPNLTLKYDNWVNIVISFFGPLATFFYPSHWTALWCTDGADSCALNAVCFLTQSELGAVNSIGQLKVWDIRQQSPEPVRAFVPWVVLSATWNEKGNLCVTVERFLHYVGLYLVKVDPVHFCFCLRPVADLPQCGVSYSNGLHCPSVWHTGVSPKLSEIDVTREVVLLLRFGCQ